MGCAPSQEPAPPEPAPPPVTEFKWEDDDEEEKDEMPAELPPMAPPMKPPRLAKQRASISAECFTPGQTVFSKKVIPKSEKEKQQCMAVVNTAFLLKSLDEQQKDDIVNAAGMEEFGEGVEIIAQGDKVAETFYLLSEGTAEAFVDGKKVMSYKAGAEATFGELALMYNNPRAATVKTTSSVKCFTLDRTTFRELVINSNHIRRKKYEDFLRTCPILKTLDDAEVALIADVLEPSNYEPGSVIIKEGVTGDTFFLLEEGEVVATTSSDAGYKKTYKRGDYFGELALLKDDDIRKATCTATKKCAVVMMDRACFHRLLGPIESLLVRNAEMYHRFVEEEEEA